VSAPGYAFGNDGSLGFYRIGTTDLGLSLSGTKAMEWTATTITTFFKTAVKGTATNDSAAAGYVGDMSGTMQPAVNAAATTQWGDITTISLTAGDWDVSGVVEATHSGAT
jgi:hypothetical protein